MATKSKKLFEDEYATQFKKALKKLKDPTETRRLPVSSTIGKWIVLRQNDRLPIRELKESPARVTVADAYLWSTLSKTFASASTLIRRRCTSICPTSSSTGRPFVGWT